MSEALRFVGRSEKAFLVEAITHFGGAFASLSKNALTRDPAQVILLTDLLDKALETRVEKEEAEAKRKWQVIVGEKLDVAKWKVFQDAEKARKDLKQYRTRLEAARAEDATWRAANPIRVEGATEPERQVA